MGYPGIVKLNPNDVSMPCTVCLDNEQLEMLQAYLVDGVHPDCFLLLGFKGKVGLRLAFSEEESIGTTHDQPWSWFNHHALKKKNNYCDAVVAAQV